MTSARALGSRLPSPADFDTYGLRIDVGDELSMELMLDHLIRAGYVRQEPVSSVGEFSQRGGIVDIFSPLMTYPVRIEFFGILSIPFANSIRMTKGRRRPCSTSTFFRCRNASPEAICFASGLPMPANDGARNDIARIWARSWYWRTTVLRFRGGSS